MADGSDRPDESMSAYAALTRILDIHYQAKSARHPEGECAVCFHYDRDSRQVLGDRFPCATVTTAREGLGLDVKH